MKVAFVSIFLFLFYQGRAQTTTEYIKLLTSSSTQSWKLDSVAIQGYGDAIYEFQQGAILIFKLEDKSVIIKISSKKDIIRKWQLNLNRYASLEIEKIKPFEIDFIQKNNLIYMRLRDAVVPEKNIYVCEYYLKKIN